MKKVALLAILTLLSLCGFGSAPASANLLLNGSFENPPVDSGTSDCIGLNGCFGFEVGQTIGTGWTVFGPGCTDMCPRPPIIILSNDYAAEAPRFFTAQDGNQSVDLTGASNQGPNGVQQVVTLAPGAYELSFWIGRQGTGTFYNGSAAATLVINGIDQNTFANTLNDLALNINWQQFIFNFAASGPTTIAFRNASLVIGPDGQNEVGLDNVSLLPVPEPGTLGLIGLGLLGLGAMARRRRYS